MEQTLEEYLKKDYAFTCWYSEEDKVFIICFPDLRGCMSHGDTIEEAIKAGMDMKNLWLETVLEDGLIPPEPTFNVDEFFKIEDYLHKELRGK